MPAWKEWLFSRARPQGKEVEKARETNGFLDRIWTSSGLPRGLYIMPAGTVPRV